MAKHFDVAINMLAASTPARFVNTFCGTATGAGFRSAFNMRQKKFLFSICI